MLSCHGAPRHARAESEPGTRLGRTSPLQAWILLDPWETLSTEQSSPLLGGSYHLYFFFLFLHAVNITTPMLALTFHQHL